MEGGTKAEFPRCGWRAPFSRAVLGWGGSEGLVKIDCSCLNSPSRGGSLGVSTTIRPEDVRKAFAKKLLSRFRPESPGTFSSGRGSGTTVDFQRIRSHQLGTRLLFDESYTPRSSKIGVPSLFGLGLLASTSIIGGRVSCPFLPWRL